MKILWLLLLTMNMYEASPSALVDYEYVWSFSTKLNITLCHSETSHTVYKVWRISFYVKYTQNDEYKSLHQRQHFNNRKRTKLIKQLKSLRWNAKRKFQQRVHNNNSLHTTHSSNYVSLRMYKSITSNFLLFQTHHLSLNRHLGMQICHFLSSTQFH